ncbi:hypothetical protein [Bradyrhizobium icense]|uniref:hypothetical protein n=1 Tax=Bradyrhizobium icense TaxID=1274631 RepID=UPI0012E9F024|nr:hypothetical protein [Bradyrhizobium icense]
MNGRLDSRPFSLQHYAAQRFISRSQNKDNGTANYQEHQAIPFVVGAGNADT